MNRELETLAWVRHIAASGRACAIRTEARLSYSELGRAVGVAHSTIARWERGERTPHGRAAIRYGNVLRQLEGLQEAQAAA